MIIFLSWGGDSLIALELVERICTQTHLPLTIAMFFENATIKQLANISFPGMEVSND